MPTDYQNIEQYLAYRVTETLACLYNLIENPRALLKRTEVLRILASFSREKLYKITRLIDKVTKPTAYQNID